jgi:5,10-methylenetetrahydromethanopterin reductase
MVNKIPRFGLGVFTDELPQDNVELARHAEALGFDTVWVPDERFCREVYSTMTLLALCTERVKIGTAVTDPYSRHPALTALAIATVDEISKGRALLGMGAGSSGFKELGIDRRKPIVAMREAVKVIRLLLEEKKVDFSGEIVKLKETNLFFPARSDIPIYLAGRGPRLMELAGEVADGAILGAGRGNSARNVRYGLEHIRKGAEKAGRDPNSLDIMSWIFTSISEDADDAKKIMKGLAISIVDSADISALKSLGVSEDLATSVKQGLRKIGYVRRPFHLVAKGERREVLEVMPDEISDQLMMAGTPEDCAKRVSELFEAGSKLITIVPFPAAGDTKRAMIRMFAETVISKYK